MGTLSRSEELVTDRTVLEIAQLRSDLDSAVARIDRLIAKRLLELSMPSGQSRISLTRASYNGPPSNGTISPTCQ